MRKSQFTSGGVRHATITLEPGGRQHRLHLRLKDPTKDNFLWIDGQSPPLVLDTVAGDFVAFYIDAMWKFQQDPEDRSSEVKRFVVEFMYAKYGRQFALPWKRVTRAKIGRDLERVLGTIKAVAETKCPVEAGLGLKEIDPTKWAAPARMDLALTYRCNLNCPHCYLPGVGAGDKQDVRELPILDWVQVFAKLWDIGIPQVVFTGGEPTLREDLVDLVTNAEEFVTGLVTNGTKLAELAEPLRAASLDYVQVTLETPNPDVHNRMVCAPAGVDAFGQTYAGIRRALALGMEVTTNTTLTRENAALFPDLIRFGKQELGLRTMSCNTLICSGRGIVAKQQNGLSLSELKAVLEGAVKVAQQVGVNLQWFSPTCYKHLNPVELGLGAKGCSAAAQNMTIQPDGSVLPCQSWPEAVGNILTDPWQDIWGHPVCKGLREHSSVQSNPACRVCEHNEVCGGACPLDKDWMSRLRAETHNPPEFGGGGNQ